MRFSYRFLRDAGGAGCPCYRWGVVEKAEHFLVSRRRARLNVPRVLLTEVPLACETPPIFENKSQNNSSYVCPEPVLANHHRAVLLGVSGAIKGGTRFVLTSRAVAVVRAGLCKKTVVFLSHLYIKTNILPRQARDKHRKTHSKDDRFLAAR